MISGPMRNVLEDIGLTKGESQVYMALLSLGSSRTGQLAKESRISSSKVYEVLERLMQKGLASYVVRNNTRHYSPTPVKRLMDFLDDRQQQIKDSKAQLEKVIPEIESIRRKKEGTVTVYEGKKGVRAIVNDIIDCQRGGDELFTFGSDQNVFEEKYPDLAYMYSRVAQEENLKSRAVFSTGKGTKGPAENARYLPSGLLSPVRTAVYGRQVAIFKFAEPVSVIVIDDEYVSAGYRKQFEYLWKTAKKIG